jgi:hypothetical protein
LLAREYIEKLIKSGQLAIESIDEGNIQKALGDLDFVEDRLRAAKILLREELKGGMENECNDKKRF